MHDHVISDPMMTREELIISWIQELTENSAVTATDYFLLVGGHSMMAVELNARVLDAFGAEVDLQVLFEYDLKTSIATLPAPASHHAEGGAW